ncbi:MAG TPA: class I SAM-dependent methyltransferase [Steroidobacteraceae bacterium]|nr:class I SAM-dependent methyltransferase [Steroidobacteraceae bacterium]
MRRIVHWPRTRRLVYLQANATPEFWDSHWRAEGRPAPVSGDDPVLTVTRQYLAAPARILEGGCGRGNKVKAMADAGFEAVGIDFAPESVAQAKRDYPRLDIRLGDVRSLPIPSASFDGYWSIGVIEHFWEGYASILREAARVLRPSGFLFLTAPWFSPYRQRRASSGGYPSEDFVAAPESFYQFALHRREVSEQLQAHGFRLLRWSGLASAVCMREDMTTLRSPVQWLLGSRGSILKRALRRAVLGGLNPYCGHSFLAVARRP